MFGIGVDFVVTVDVDDKEFVSTIDVVGSVTIAVDVVDAPLATSSITSSICDRDVVFVDDGVDACFSVLRFDDETIFDTIVIKSFCCVGVDTLVVVTGVVGVVAVVVCRDC
jgi:hypothetical protein